MNFEDEPDDSKIPGPYKDLARLVRTLIKGASTRAVWQKTGVNANTVSTMLKGGRGSRDNTVKLARGYKINPNRLLSLSGYETVPEFDTAEWGKDAGASPPAVKVVGDLADETDNPMPVLEGYKELDEADREVVSETMRAIVEALLRHKRRRTIGRPFRERGEAAGEPEGQTGGESAGGDGGGAGADGDGMLAS